MRLPFAFCLLFSFIVTDATARDLPDFTVLVEENKPAVVNISTTRKQTSARRMLPKQFEIPEGELEAPLNDLLQRFFGVPPGSDEWLNQPDARSLGSGFIISADGYVVTNNHVVSGADEIIVRLDDRRELQATLVGTDARSDIALLKIDAKDLPQVKLGDSGKLKVGEWVLAIGSPFGFDHSATAGIVSALGRSLPNENYVPFIQTDVAINPGNSGGPLFNLDGQVVGVNSQIYSRTGGFMGLSFAIPIELVLDVVEQLKTDGHVARGWLGVLIQEVTRELAESFKMSKPQGALVSKVLPDSPALQAGIQAGDVILEFNGKTVERSAALPPMVGQVKIGANAKVVVLRDGRKQTLTVRIGALPDEKPVAAKSPAPVKSGASSRLGMTLKDPDAALRREYNLDQGGVAVVEVQSGPAATAGIRSGDVITLLNNKPVAGVEDFLRSLDQLKAGSSVALLIQRSSGPIYLALRIPKNE
jgi:serine protease Do